VVYYRDNTDYPNAHFYYKDDIDSLYAIRIFLNSDETVTHPITYIKWDDTDMDTIKATYKRTDNTIVLDSIWYNNNLIWNSNDNVRKSFIIMK